MASIAAVQARQQRARETGSNHDHAAADHRRRRRHHRRFDRVAPGVGRRTRRGRRSRRGRRRGDARLLRLDQCQLGQSRALFSPAHPRHGGMASAGRGGAGHPADLDGRPVLGPAAGPARSLCPRAWRLGLWHPRRRSCRSRAHRAAPRRGPGPRAACGGGEGGGAARGRASVARGGRTPRRPDPAARRRHRARPEEWRDRRDRDRRRPARGRRGRPRGGRRPGCSRTRVRMRGCWTAWSWRRHCICGRPPRVVS
jgi:hypothetical protein